MFAEVMLPTVKSVTATKTYTYEIPQELSNLKIGQLVNVPFGKYLKPAIVCNLTTIKPDFKTKPVESIIHKQPLLPPSAIELIKRASSYYLSTPHRICKLFLPTQILNKKIEPKLEKDSDRIKASSFIRKLKLSENHKLHTPTAEQQDSIDQISPNIKSQTQNTHLIWGPTGSGKTEIYLQLLKVLNKEQQAVILVPEISLTPQLTQYFYDHFPQQVAVWHSELNATEKKNAWWRIKTGQTKIMIGSRSCLFLPYEKLGLIVIDEEQANAFKQDQNPRYHARTIAQWLSQLHNCPLVLGTATPTLETYQAHLKNRVRTHKLTKRVHDTTPPQIQIIDMKQEVKKGNFSIISETLEQQISTTLASNKQVLLYLNRRGYSASIQCYECGEIESCNNCDISLTMHQNYKGQFLQCHLCGQIYNNPTSCRNCKSRKIKNVGLGTQQVETTIKELFPKARVLRADKDTTRAKHSFSEIYHKFKNHEADVLIGTQMVSKGLHIPKVDLVGVLLADIGLHIPDFRATERAFQTLKQVCGRAGRSKDQGQVVIQTLSPNHTVLQSLVDENIEEFYTKELLIRSQHEYPPFSKITKLTCVHPNEKQCLKNAAIVEQKLQQMQVEHLGSPALVFRQYNKYHYNILIFRNSPEAIISQLGLTPEWRIDRDPMETS